MKKVIAAGAVLGVFIVGGALYGIEQGQIASAQAALQNHVNRAAAQALQEIERFILLELELTGADGEVRNVEIAVSPAELSGELLAEQVPADSLLTHVQMHTVHISPPARLNEAVAVPGLGSAEIEIAFERRGLDTAATAVGRATAGWLKRQITATATAILEGEQVLAEAREAVKTAAIEAARAIAQRRTIHPVEVVIKEPAPPSDAGKAASDAGSEPGASTPSAVSSPAALDPELVFRIPPSGELPLSGRRVSGAEIDEAIRNQRKKEAEMRQFQQP